MGVFTGGAAAEIITPTFVSPTVAATGGLAPSTGADSIYGGAGTDTLDGGRGDDTLEGGFDADRVSGGDGNDTVLWNPGGGSDTIDGGAGLGDALVFSTANATETIGVSGQAGHVLVTRDVASIALDVDNVERIAFTAFGGLGADRYLIGDLAGTDVRQVEIDIGATPDGVADLVQVAGSAAGDALSLSVVDGATRLAGLTATVAVRNGETLDRLAVLSGGGADTLDASALGDGITVNFDAGDGVDLLTYRGSAADDAIQLYGGQQQAEGRLLQAVVNGGASQVNLTALEGVLVDTGAGADTVHAGSYSSPIPLTISTGLGDDRVQGSAGQETILGGKGNDYLDGGFNADLVNGEDGDDVIAWNPGGGSDTIDGGAGLHDTLLFNTANIGEAIGVSAKAGGHVQVTRDIASIALDVDNVERIAFAAVGGGGADRFQIDDLAGADVKQVDIDLGLTPDNQADVVRVMGAAAGDSLTAAFANGVTTLSGLAATVGVTHAEAIDRLAVASGMGDDTLDASALGGGMVVNLDGGEGTDALAYRGGVAGDTITLAAGSSPGTEGHALYVDLNGAGSQVNLTSVETLVVDLGAGDDRVAANSYNGPAALAINVADGDDTVFGGVRADTIAGGRGADVIDGGFNADVVNAGDGDDRITWNAGGGSDVIDGGRGLDTLAFNTTNIGETITVSELGGHAIVTRDVAAITLDVDNVERIAFGGSGGGADRFFVSGLGLSDVGAVDIDLGLFGGGGDGAADTILMSGNARGDKLVITGGGGSATVTGLGAELHVTDGEVADYLTINGLDGADIFDMSGFAGGGLALRLNGGSGVDRFVVGPGSARAQVEIVQFQTHAALEGDQVMLVGFADQSFASAVANHHIVQSGMDVLIDDGTGAIIRLLETSLTDLGAADFLFR